jgi:hypothetical protein
MRGVGFRPCPAGDTDDAEGSDMISRGYGDMGQRIRDLCGAVWSLVKHVDLWKWDGLGPNGQRWRCRRCGRGWTYHWR